MKIKRLIYGLVGLVFTAGAAQAVIVGSLPFTLQAGTTAVAAQVMANYQKIIDDVNANAAANGANSDITSLLGLTTPLGPTSGGSSFYIGGTSGGAANVQTLATPSPTGWSLTNGKRVSFLAGFTNTGSATLNVAAGGAKTIKKATMAGLANLESGEIVAANQVTVVYLSGPDVYQIVSPIPWTGRFIGDVADCAVASAPTAWILGYGQAISRTTYAALFAAYSTTYGVGDGSTTFNVPDYRGRVLAGKDNMGGSAANRLTTAGSSVDGLTLGAVGGAQNVALTTAELATHSHGVTDPGHTHSYDHAGTVQGAANGAVTVWFANNTDTDATTSATTGISINNAGSGDAHLNVQPTIIQNKCIFTGVP